MDEPLPVSAPGAGQVALDELVRLLDLERIEVDIFRGTGPNVTLQRVFGGQVAGQALVAAGRTLPPDRPVHSLHAYFLRPGDPAIPIVYTVDRIRDGRSFTSRRVVAVQHGAPIFSLSASFHRAEPGVDHQTDPPDVPDPASLPTLAQRFGGFTGRMAGIPTVVSPLDLRYVDAPSWARAGQGPAEPVSRVWMRANGTLPDDPLIHVCALTYASDLSLLDSVLIGHGLSWEVDHVSGASLDHAMWFHRPFRADEWLLYESRSPSASGARGLAEGRFWTQDGRHVATVVQEGLIRIPVETQGR